MCEFVRKIMGTRILMQRCNLKIIIELDAHALQQ